MTHIWYIYIYIIYVYVDSNVYKKLADYGRFGWHVHVCIPKGRKDAGLHKSNRTGVSPALKRVFLKAIYENITCSHCGAKLHPFAWHDCNHPYGVFECIASRLHAWYIKETITIHQTLLWPTTAPKSSWKISFFPLRMRVCPVADVQCHGNHWNLGGIQEKSMGWWANLASRVSWW